ALQRPPGIPPADAGRAPMRDACQHEAPTAARAGSQKTVIGRRAVGKFCRRATARRHDGATVMTMDAMEMTRPVDVRERRASRTAQRPRDSCLEVPDGTAVAWPG